MPEPTLTAQLIDDEWGFAQQVDLSVRKADE